MLIDKQIGEETLRRHKEDLNLFYEEEEDLDQLDDKKNSLILQYNKKFIEVQIFARREFLDKTSNPDIFLFNMNRFIIKNVCMHYDIKNSKEFLSALIDDLISTKETFSKYELASNNNNYCDDMSIINETINSVVKEKEAKKDWKCTLVNESIVTYKDCFNMNDNLINNLSKTNYNTVNHKNNIFHVRNSNKRKSTITQEYSSNLNFISLNKKEFNVLKLLLKANLRILNKIEKLKFIYKYFIDFRFHIYMVDYSNKSKTPEEYFNIRKEEKYEDFFSYMMTTKGSKLTDINKRYYELVKKNKQDNSNKNDLSIINSTEIKEDNNDIDKHNNSICNFTELLQNTTIMKNYNPDNFFTNINTNTHQSEAHKEDNNMTLNDFSVSPVPLRHKPSEVDDLDDISKIEDKFNQSEMLHHEIMLRNADI